MSNKWQLSYHQMDVIGLVALLSTGRLLLPINAKRGVGAQSFSFARLPVGENLPCGLQR